ncbi:MAG: PD40 domain-containing protein, partial [Chloroflexi bacterium]|nr:PD40 domain-containing protein [Chloroflexota bacterium]
MRRASGIVGLLVVAACAVPVLAGQAAAPPRFTVEEMLKLRRVSDPRLSPDGARIAYVVTDVSLEKNTRTSSIWVVPVGGGEPVGLEREPAAADSPSWSPDGRQIAFVSARDGSAQIWIASVSPSGQSAGEPRKLTSLATEAGGVKWSPDGRWLAFTSDVYPGCDTIACNEARLKEQEGRKSRAHVFDHLLFRHWTSWKDGRFSHLFVVPADGSGAPRDLTPGEADVPPLSLGGPDDYAFSPDSREIAFARKTDPVEAISTNSDLFVLDLATPGAQARQ